MTARQYLSQLRRLDLMIDHKLSELGDLRVKASAIGGFDYAREKVMTSPPPDAPYAKTIQKIIDLDAELNAEVDRYVDLKQDIIRQIQLMEDLRFSDLLYKRYVEYKAFEDISSEMHYSCSYVRRLHGRALQRFEEMYPELPVIEDIARRYDIKKEDTQ